MRSNWPWIIGLSIVFVILGGLREIVFVNINEQIEFLAGRRDGYYVLDSLQFLKNFSISQLAIGKWVLTILFMVLNFSLSILALTKALVKPKATRWLTFLFIAGFLISGGVYVLGKLTGEAQLGYTLSRRIMGALQSPFPLMMLIPALYLDKSDE